MKNRLIYYLVVTVVIGGATYFSPPLTGLGLILVPSSFAIVFLLGCVIWSLMNAPNTTIVDKLTDDYTLWVRKEKDRDVMGMSAFILILLTPFAVALVMANAFFAIPVAILFFKLWDIDCNTRYKFANQAYANEKEEAIDFFLNLKESDDPETKAKIAKYSKILQGE